jgi:hypothetical protein
LFNFKELIKVFDPMKTIHLFDRQLSDKWLLEQPTTQLRELASQVIQILSKGPLGQWVQASYARVPVARQLDPELAIPIATLRLDLLFAHLNMPTQERELLHRLLDARTEVQHAIQEAIDQPIFTVKDKEIAVPRVLVDRSPTWKQWQTWSESLGCSAESYEQALLYCKTLQAPLKTTAEALELLQTAHRLQLAHLKRLCCDYLAKNMCGEQWHAIWCAAEKAEAPLLQRHCIAYHLHQREAIPDAHLEKLGLAPAECSQTTAEVRARKVAARLKAEPPLPPLFEYLESQRPNFHVKTARGTWFTIHYELLEILVPKFAPLLRDFRSKNRAVKPAEGADSKGDSSDGLTLPPEFTSSLIAVVCDWAYLGAAPMFWTPAAWLRLLDALEGSPIYQDLQRASGSEGLRDEEAHADRAALLERHQTWGIAWEQCFANLTGPTRCPASLGISAKTPARDIAEAAPNITYFAVTAGARLPCVEMPKLKSLELDVDLPTCGLSHMPKLSCLMLHPVDRPGASKDEISRRIQGITQLLRSVAVAQPDLEELQGPNGVPLRQPPRLLRILDKLHAPKAHLYAPGIERLALATTLPDEAAIEQLSQLSNWQHLTVHTRAVALQALTRCPTLKLLYITQPLGNEPLPNKLHAPRLTTLTLVAPTDQQLLQIAKDCPLRHLALFQEGSVTQAGWMAAAPHLKSLRILHIHHLDSKVKETLAEHCAKHFRVVKM